jgi:DNA-binding transcriptional LysR family regulator
MDDLSRIHTFMRVAQLGSFSAAARQLDISVTSIARQINSLEADLEVRLINRSSRRLALTEPGRLFYQRACKISSELRNAMEETTSFQETVKGVLRISLRPSVGNLVIVPALCKFLRRYPNVKVHVSLAEERQDLIENDIDVAVWMGTIPDAGIVARRLSPAQRVVCAAPEYLHANGIPVRPEDLRNHNCLLFDAPTYGKKWTFKKDGLCQEVEVDGLIQTDNALTLYTSALAGAGIIVAHQWAARTLISQGRLISVLDEYEVTYSAIGAELYAVYSSSRGLSRKVRAFVDFLVELFDVSNVSSRSCELEGTSNNT